MVLHQAVCRQLWVYLQVLDWALSIISLGSWGPWATCPRLQSHDVFLSPGRRSGGRGC